MATKGANQKSKTRSPQKASASRTATSPKRRRATRSSKARAKAWRSWMPERIESIDLLRNTLTRLDETRGAQELNEAIARFGLALGGANQRLQDMERKTRAQAAEQVTELLDLIMHLPAMDSFSLLPERALESIDEALERVGLVRRSKHLLELENAKRKAQRATMRKIRRAEKAKAANIAAKQGEG